MVAALRHLSDATPKPKGHLEPGSFTLLFVGLHLLMSSHPVQAAQSQAGGPFQGCMR